MSMDWELAMASEMGDVEAILEYTPAYEAAAVEAEVDAIVSRMIEAQQPDNRFRAAIIQDTADQAEQIKQFNAGEIQGIQYNKALKDELSKTQQHFDQPILLEAKPKEVVEDDMTQPNLLQRLISGASPEQMGIPPGGELSVGSVPGIISGLNALIPGGIVAGATALAGLAISRTKAPWETAEGVGWIAPWQNQVLNPDGTYSVQGSGPQGRGGSGAGFAGAAGMGVAYGWNNAAKDGSTKATAEFIRTVDGKTYVRSLKTGVIKRVKRVRITAVHRNMRLGDVARAQRTLDSLYKQVAKRTPLQMTPKTKTVYKELKD